MLHPQRMHGVVAMSVPLLPRGPMPPVQLMRQIFADTFFYIVSSRSPAWPTPTSPGTQPRP
jgi:hypothetical protein